MSITVREFGESDKASLISCIESLQKHIVEIDPLQRQVLSEGYKEWYTDKLLKSVGEKEGKIYFAEEGLNILGFIAGTIQKEPQGGTLEVIPSHPAWIRELYINEESRGKGVGSLLITTLENYFKSKGCDVILVGVFAPNIDSHSFYESKGYVDRDITMLKQINS